MICKNSSKSLSYPSLRERLALEGQKISAGGRLNYFKGISLISEDPFV